VRAAVLTRPGPVEGRPLSIEDVPEPQATPGTVAIRVRACAVCRTDLHVVAGELAPRRPKHPRTPGRWRTTPVPTVKRSWLRRRACRSARTPRRFPLASANEALAALKNDAMRGAAVLTI
jgi:hypothetical protein